MSKKEQVEGGGQRRRSKEWELKREEGVNINRLFMTKW